MNKDYTEEELVIMKCADELSLKLLDHLAIIQPYVIINHEKIFNHLTDEGIILFWGKIINNITSKIVEHLIKTNHDFTYDTKQLITLINENNKICLNIPLEDVKNKIQLIN